MTNINDLLASMQQPKQEYKEEAIPEDVETFESQEDNDSEIPADIPADSPPEAEANQPQKPNKKEEKITNKALSEGGELITLTIDFTIRKICEQVAQKKQLESEKSDIENISYLWGKFLNERGKTVPTWILLAVSNVAIYGPMIGTAIIERLEMERKKRSDAAAAARIKAEIIKREMENAAANAAENPPENATENAENSDEDSKIEPTETVNFQSIDKNKQYTHCIMCNKKLVATQKRFCTRKCAAQFGVHLRAQNGIK